MHKVRCRNCYDLITFGTEPKSGKTIPLDAIDQRPHNCYINNRQFNERIGDSRDLNVEHVMNNKRSDRSLSSNLRIIAP